MQTLVLNTSIIDREDLTIYEKMCCVVLARFSVEDPPRRYTVTALALGMGCSEREAKKALESLKNKGLLFLDPEIELEELKKRRPRVIKKGADAPKATFEAFEGAEAAPEKRSQSELMLELRGFILEPVTDATLRILLNMASGDTERIRKGYEEALRNPGTDVFEYLIHALQSPLPGRGSAENSGPEPTLEAGTQKVLTQINQHRIAELYRKNRSQRGADAPEE